MSFRFVFWLLAGMQTKKARLQHLRAFCALPAPHIFTVSALSALRNSL